MELARLEVTVLLFGRASLLMYVGFCVVRCFMRPAWVGLRQLVETSESACRLNMSIL